MRTALCGSGAIAAGSVAAGSARGQSARYCLPKPNGVDRIVKLGGRCPIGYFGSGDCCEAYRAAEPRAIPKRGNACPSGFYPSNDHYCVSYR